MVKVIPPKENLHSAHMALVGKESELSKTKSFEDVFAIIELITSSIWGLGKLYSYDTALRLAATRMHEPSVVYLHPGVRVGAKQLRIPVNREFIKLEELRPELHRLKAHEVEDLLWLYKNQLGAVR